MNLKILGTRGKIPQSAPRYEKYSGILLDDQILIDLGEAEYLKYEPKAIVFTHFHPDHAFFVSGTEKFDPQVPLYGPEEQELIPHLKTITKEFRIGEFSFTPIPVIHALRLKSFGYLIQKEGKSVLITGDVAWIEKANLKNLPKVDLVVTEASFMRKGGMIRRQDDKIFGHTGIPDLIRLLGPHTSRMVFVHYGSWFFKDIEKARDKLKSFETDELKVIPAHDGMEIKL